MLKPGVSSGFMASSAAVLATNVPTLVAECSGSIASLTLGREGRGSGQWGWNGGLFLLKRRFRGHERVFNNSSMSQLKSVGQNHAP